tara:strand:- start:861 stop:1592 length:732 start_codon:yes stop_codon:yes gene_type:complete
MWYDEACKEWGDINYEINKAYCEKHGYDLIRDSERRIPSRMPHFERIALIREYLPQYDHVIWIDADAYFYIDSPPIQHVIDTYNEFDFILSEDICHRDWRIAPDHINTGIFCVKNTPYSMRILDLWGYDKNLYNSFFNDGNVNRQNHGWNHGFSEQEVLKKLFHEDIHDLKKHALVLPFGFLQIFSEDDRLHLTDHALEALSFNDMEKSYIFHHAGQDISEPEKTHPRTKGSSDYYNLYIKKK